MMSSIIFQSVCSVLSARHASAFDWSIAIDYVSVMLMLADAMIDTGSPGMRRAASIVHLTNRF